MKKIFTFIFILGISAQFAKAQNDTLLYENFNVDPTGAYLTLPNGNDLDWVTADLDGQTDANSRPVNWYWSDLGFSTNDTTGCIISSSWFSSPAQCNNWLITPPIQIVDANAVLYWKAAPYQTPLYLDGYKVMISTTSNLDVDFTDTAFVAAEYLSGSSSNGANYNAYSFSPGFIHGEDGTYTEFDASSDSSRLLGVLRPFNVSLAQYAGQTIYIAFVHDAFDDNLISVDDILVTGTLPVGLPSPDKNSKLSVQPNPASDLMKVNFNLPVSASVNIKVYDVKGAVVKDIQRGTLLAGQQETDLNVSDLSKGNYTLKLTANNKYQQIPFVVIR